MDTCTRPLGSESVMVNSRASTSLKPFSRAMSSGFHFELSVFSLESSGDSAPSQARRLTSDWLCALESVQQLLELDDVTCTPSAVSAYLLCLFCLFCLFSLFVLRLLGPLGPST